MINLPYAKPAAQNRISRVKELEGSTTPRFCGARPRTEFSNSTENVHASASGCGSLTACGNNYVTE